MEVGRPLGRSLAQTAQLQAQTRSGATPLHAACKALCRPPKPPPLFPSRRHDAAKGKNGSNEASAATEMVALLLDAAATSGAAIALASPIAVAAEARKAHDDAKVRKALLEGAPVLPSDDEEGDEDEVANSDGCNNDEGFSKDGDSTTSSSSSSSSSSLERRRRTARESAKAKAFLARVGPVARRKAAAAAAGKGRREALARVASAVDGEGVTPLHHAATRGDAAVVVLLLEAGAKPEARSVLLCVGE